MILLVHSCDSREWIWEHWWRFFDRSGWDVEVRFITGDKEFSDQLIEELSGMKDEYLWYTLDDYFIVEQIDWKYYENLARELSVDALRLQPNVFLNSLPYRFEVEGELFKQTPESEYHISMNTSIWRREYFLDCLYPGLDPWQTERRNPRKLGNVYFVPRLPFWYIDATRKGVLTDKGQKYIND